MVHCSQSTWTNNYLRCVVRNLHRIPVTSHILNSLCRKPYLQTTRRKCYTQTYYYVSIVIIMYEFRLNSVLTQNEMMSR